MQYRKLGRFRIDGPATGGMAATVSLGPTAGGRMCKGALYMLKILQVSSTQAKLGLALSHGPDGQVAVLHSTPIANTQLTGANAFLLAGQSDLSLMLGEYLDPALTCISNDASVCWVLVEVYEMRKPF